MTILIEAPAGYPAERGYVLDVVLGRWLGLDWRLEQGDRRDVRISVPGDSDGRAIVLPDGLFGTPRSDWLSPASVPAGPLPTVEVAAPGSSALRAGERLPVIFGSTSGSSSELVASGPDGVSLPIDVFGSCFFMLTRYEELAVQDRDSWDRFPASASVAGRQGLLTYPIVDAYVEALWIALEGLWPRLRRSPRDYRVVLTHDVDDALASVGRGAARTARQFAGDVVLRKDLRVAARRARALAAARRGDFRHDPHNTFDLLMDVSERSGLRSAFYFQSHDAVDLAADSRYSLEHPWVRELIRTVYDRGHEIGYHAGFGTYRDAARTAKELDYLRAVAEAAGARQQEWGGRQHYLQWANPTTWRNCEAAGMAYDCTLGYAEALGFRTGTCHPYPAFDLLEGRPLALREHPFQVMDVTAFRYLALSPGAAMSAVLDIARECRRFGGQLGIDWHNDECMRTDREKRWYRAMVQAVLTP